MPEIVSGAEYATFINTFRCDPANQEEVVRINIDIVDQVASSSPGFIAAAVRFATPDDAWRCTDEYVAASDVVAAPIEMIGTFLVPPPAGRAGRDFQTLHFDFGVPHVPFAAADVARLTALHVPAWVSSAQALTRFVGLRPLLSGHTWPGLEEWCAASSPTAPATARGSQTPGMPRAASHGLSKRRSPGRRPCPASVPIPTSCAAPNPHHR